jgi:hypothetical protein
MATKRKTSANRRASGKPAAQRRAQCARKRRPARRRARAGARESRRAQAARQVERDAAAAAAQARGRVPEIEPHAANDPAWAGEAEGIPGYARLVATPQPEADAERREEAEAELSRRREEAERAAAGEPGSDVPTMRDIAVELAIGSMRLVRTLATAPLRIGLAFLREG